LTQQNSSTNLRIFASKIEFLRFEIVYVFEQKFSYL
jgi:hypothetical protein